GREDVFVTTVEGGRLFHNEGRGRFLDVTDRAGIRNRDFAVSAAWVDYDRDGLADLFVGHYVKWSPDVEVTCAQEGVKGYCGPDAYKPVAPKLYRNRRSGRPHLLVGNFLNEMLGLYHNTDGQQFVDVAPRSPVGRASLLSVTWGVFFLDYDLDGLLDIFAANGGTDESQGMDARARLSQAPLLMRNRGNGAFENVTPSLGAAFNRPMMARGAAYADFDGDGDLDIAVATLAGPAHLFRNDGGNRNNWLSVRAVGGRSNKSA